MNFSLIIPVYNRPFEIGELLESLSMTTYPNPFEVIIVEDGSTQKSDEVVKGFSQSLSISYYYKENSGPGDSRNFGMQKAKGDYFLIFDSDCIIPKQYLTEVETALNEHYVDCFGGPDAALDSFSDIQKAINFAMTSFVTTGGIRGGSEKISKFQPRSFNMGISKKAFESSGGFGNIHPGEDPDLSLRLWGLGFETRLFPKAFVYHKRRIDWDKFSTQVGKFGKARPILNHWHPKSSKLTYLAPTIFLILLLTAIIALLFGIALPIILFGFYFLLILIMATLQNRNLKIGFLSVYAVALQFYGYGTGFIRSWFKINIKRQKPQEAFPELFFKK